MRSAAAPGGPFDRAMTRDEVVARIQSIDLGEEPAAMRAAFARLVLGDAGSEGVGAAIPASVGIATERWGVDGIGVRPAGAPDDRVVVWLHGGGYVFGAPETHVRPAAWLAGRLGVPVFLPRYRRAPEHPWPAPLDDARACVAALRAADRRVALAGDSAGGHLALVLALALARAGQPAEALVLFSPNTDRTGLSDTRAENDPRDPMVDEKGDRRLACLAFGDRPPEDPEVSPVLGDLACLPPTHVEVGADEVLLGDSRVLYGRALAAGADITLCVDDAGLHMGPLWTPWWEGATASIERAARRLEAFAAR